jgi:hypothetical protein
MNAQATFVEQVNGAVSASSSSINSTAIGEQLAAQKESIIFSALPPNVSAVCDPSLFIISCKIK